MKKYGDRIVCAGGFLRSAVTAEKPHDMDLFCQSPEDAKAFATELADGAGVIETGNALTVIRKAKFSVQFIHRWTYTNPERLLDSFDYTIAKAAFWFDPRGDGSSEDVNNGGSGKWRGICDDRFYSDLAAHRLVYTSPQRNEDAGGSILRALKFYQRGFRIPLDSLGAVIARLVVGIDDDRLAGVGERLTREERWAKVVTGLLREVDPNVDPEHAAHLPAQGAPPAGG